MLLLASVLILLIIHVYNVRRAPRDGAVSPVTIASLSFVFYTVTVPVELSLRGATSLGFTRFDMPPETAERIIFIGVVAIVALFAGHSFAAGRDSLPQMRADDRNLRLAQRTLLLISVIGAALLLTVFRANVEASTDYLDNVAQTAVGAGSTGYFVINRWTYLSYAMFAFLAIGRSRRRWRAALTIVPLVAWAVYSNDKDPILAGSLALTGLLLSHEPENCPRVERRTAPGIVAIVMALGVGALAFGENRAGRDLGDITLRSIIDEGLFVNVDPVGPSTVLALELAQPGGTGSLTPTLLALFAWLPSILRPFSVPTDLAVTFAQQYWANWRPGYGYGYSPLAEGWQGGGLVGVALVLGFMGVVLGASRRILLRDNGATRGSLPVRYAAYYVVVGYLAFIAMRGTLMSFMTTGFISLLLVVITILTTRFLVARPEEAPPSRAPTRSHARGRR